MIIFLTFFSITILILWMFFYPLKNMTKLGDFIYLHNSTSHGFTALFWSVVTWHERCGGDRFTFFSCISHYWYFMSVIEPESTLVWVSIYPNQDLDTHITGLFLFENMFWLNLWPVVFKSIHSSLYRYRKAKPILCLVHEFMRTQTKTISCFL